VTAILLGLHMLLKCAIQKCSNGFSFVYRENSAADVMIIILSREEPPAGRGRGVVGGKFWIFWRKRSERDWRRRDGISSLYLSSLSSATQCTSVSNRWKYSNTKSH